MNMKIFLMVTFSLFYFVKISNCQTCNSRCPPPPLTGPPCAGSRCPDGDYCFVYNSSPPGGAIIRAEICAQNPCSNNNLPELGNDGYTIRCGSGITCPTGTTCSLTGLVCCSA